MGQKPSSPLEQCLSNACGGRPDCVGFPSDPLFQLNWVQPYNLDISVTPTAVVRPNNADEVAAVVRCAAEHHVKVQAKSGGHSYANFGLGGDSGAVAIDLINLQKFEMDKSTWQASIGAGFKLGDVDKKLHEHGARAFAHGVCPGVGIGGHATIGGLGPMSRMWGTCLDHIVEVEVVTADGKVVRASSTANSDLFFALRGAAAGFGVITEFVMRTHPEPDQIVQYSFDFTFGRPSELAPVYQIWQDLIVDPKLDRRFGTEFIIHPLGAVITGTFYGSEEEFHASGILERLPKTSNTTIAVNDWLGSIAHDAEHEALYLSNLASAFYSKSLAMRASEVLPKQGIKEVFDFMDAADKGTLLWFIIFDASGGAIGDVPMDATAYAHRDKVLFYQSYAVGLTHVSDKMRKFLTSFHEKLVSVIPRGTYGTYPGYVDMAIRNPQAEYWMSNLPALTKVKSKWDPSDLFHNPHSVRPKGLLRR